MLSTLHVSAETTRCLKAVSSPPRHFNQTHTHTHTHTNKKTQIENNSLDCPWLIVLVDQLENHSSFQPTVDMKPVTSSAPEEAPIPKDEST